MYFLGILSLYIQCYNWGLDFGCRFIFSYFFVYNGCFLIPIKRLVWAFCLFQFELFVIFSFFRLIFIYIIKKLFFLFFCLYKVLEFFFQFFKLTLNFLNCLLICLICWFYFIFNLRFLLNIHLLKLHDLIVDKQNILS